MAGTPLQNQWVERVLKVRVGDVDPEDAAFAELANEAYGPPDRAAGRSVSDLPALWQAARERVDAGLSALVEVMRGQDDPDLQAIAEYGLHSLTEGESVALSAALQDHRAHGAEAASRLREACARFRAALDGRRIFVLLDDNPFGVAVAARERLGGALTEIERALARSGP